MAAKKPRRTKKQAQEALGRALAKRVKAKGVAAAAIAVGRATQMVVSVQVDADHLVPYSVRWDGDRLLDAVQSDQAIVTIAPGNHVLSWSFNHLLEGTWQHKLTVKIDGQAARVLDEKNSAQNPTDAASGGLEIFVA
jgi:hypothetical protein